MSANALKPRWLRRETALILHEECLAEHGGGTGVRDEGLLESAMARPENLFAYGAPDVCEMAAAYADGIVNNHPFVDGNKRTGFLAAATFMAINGQMLIASEVDATLKTLQLAAGEIDAEGYANWLRENCEPVAD